MATADIKMGYSCNNNCIHCVISDQRAKALSLRGNQDRTTEEYKKELFDSRIRGCNCVTFTGGEPTIRKDLLRLLNYAKSLGYHIGMQTNGRLFCYKKFTEMLVPYNIKYTIALHGHNREIHEQITRSKGSFEQTINGIKNLVSSKQEVTGKLVISKKNYKYLLEIASFFINLGIKKMNFAFPHANGNAWKYFNEVVPTYTEIKDYVHKTINFVEEYNKKNNEEIWIDFEAIPFCFMAGHEKHIFELKYINSEYSEVKQLDSEGMDWGIVRKKIKSKFEKCKECQYNNLCEGVWKEYVIKCGDSEFKK